MVPEAFCFWQWKVLETFQTYRFQKSGLKEYTFCFGSLPPPKQTSVDEKDTWTDVHPIVSVSDTRPIEFEFEGKQQEFFDLAHTLLYLTVQLVKSDGSEMGGGSKVGPVRLFFHSSFRQLYISFNGRTISDGSSTYTY